jgi:hypothetical protein
MTQSSRTPLPQRLADKAVALAQEIWDEAHKSDRQRILQYLGIDEPSLPRQRTSRQVGSRYGTNAAAVRDALGILTTRFPDGVGASDLDAHFKLIGSGPDLSQCRAALKTLTLSGDAANVSRGKYLPREVVAGSAIPAGEDPDALASGRLFNPDDV